MKLVLTTIGQGQVAVVESDKLADERKGERYISEACLKVNTESGNFVVVSYTGANPEGRLFLLAEDM